MLKSNKLEAVEFARRLLETEDLDPLYVALWKVQMFRAKLCRWLVAYWCYYHAGVCCWISEQPDFFAAMLHVAYSGTAFPRGTERRHFRGDLAVTSVEAMTKQFGTAQHLVDWLIEAGPDAGEIMARVKQLRGFGDWIAWKVPDMIERLGLAPVQFGEEHLPLMFRSCIEGAKEVNARYVSGPGSLITAHRYLLRRLEKFSAPPRYERGLNVQETETIFCKWHSHLGGHYPPGKDSHEIRLGLLRFARCRTSQAMLRGVPRATGGA